MDRVEHNENTLKASSGQLQLCGFKIGDGHYAVPVLEIQEVVKPLPLSKVPMAPYYIDGLMNLRGQVVTSINLHRLFHIEGEPSKDPMNVIVGSEDTLYSLVVDEIMDVTDVDQSTFDQAPPTLNSKVRKYIDGVYKLDDKLLILINLEKILKIEE